MNPQLLETFIGQQAQDRRRFLANAGRGILSASILGAVLGDAHAGTPHQSNRSAADTIPVQLKPLDAPSEKAAPKAPAPLEPGKRIGFALVGLGHLTLEQILPAFGSSKLAKPVALVSGDSNKAKQVAGQYGISEKNIYNYQNFDDIRNNPEIDVVYIVLPNSMHEEFTVRAAAAGKHVLCEKPMANSAASAQRMIDACKKAGRKLMIAYRIQYEPHHHLLRKWTQEQQYGKVRVIEMFNAQNIGDPTQWRLNKALAGGGSLPDIGLYCLNTARFMLGEEPEWVSANIYSTPNDPRFKEVEETVLFQMGFPSGTVVNAGCSYGVHECRRYRCLADNGGWYGMDPAFPYKGLQIELSEIRNGKEWKEQPVLEAKDQFALEMDHMAQCIMDNKQPYTPGEEGLQDQKIMEAIYRSAKERRVIDLEKISGRDVFRGTPPKEES
jgi:predicted dehydrogenase